MGMYTEIIFGAALKPDTPAEVIDVIKAMVDGRIETYEPLPDHPFFRSERPWLLESAGSYYFPGIVPATFRFDIISNAWYLHFRTNIKNHDNEIQKFLAWIRPHVGQGSGKPEFCAIVTYEQGRPEIVYLEQE